MKTLRAFLTATLLVTALSRPGQAEPLPLVTGVELQPLAAQIKRLGEAAAYLGEPFTAQEQAALNAAATSSAAAAAVEAIQNLLDARCLFGVTINPEMRVKVVAGPAKPVLVEKGWRQFLVKVTNEAGTTAALRVASPHGQSVHNVRRAQNDSDRAYRATPESALAPAAESWLDLQTFDQQPLRPALSGLPLEYRIVQLYSRDAGQREAKFSFNVGQGTQDIGYRNEVDLLFNCLPAREIKLRVLDENGAPATASFLVRDAQGRIYPSQAKRLAPDFAFQPQIYRADGETLRLPDGAYEVEFRRGPESIPEKRRLTVEPATRDWRFQVRRWFDPAKLGWWSGDHHIHAAGCAHYTSPTEGVLAIDMARHCQGEDLKIGANLTWGPCFDFQKQFFTGQDDKASQYPYLLRYDIEVSGFGSHRTGHLCLLRLRNQMYPGGDSMAHWPTLGLNTLRWAKAQGALVGPAHSGWGLQPAPAGTVPRPGGPWTPPEPLPNYVVPPFNGIGANEYIMNVTHEVPGPDGRLVPAVDFLSLVDTPHTWELNIWYHTLNAGFRTRASGETDFPCIYGERVGLGRSYVKLDGPLNYEDWCEGIRVGRNYITDGKSHLIDFKVNEQAMGEKGSELKLPGARKVKVTARVAARLDEKPDPLLQRLNVADKPYWDIERARVANTREVPVEVLVNGYSVAQTNIAADGTLREIAFEVPIERSSWVALRIRASSHTNPIFVMVGDKPIRASRRSLEWCLQGLEQCWSQKESLYAPAELAQARADYEHARRVYRQRLAECEVE
ncbi:MAG: hypothetical protein EXS38_11950 [Opitutus sp.]|nr:hypothetical protein [Opitutus sp.]